MFPEEDNKDGERSWGQDLRGVTELIWFIQPGEEKVEGQPDCSYYLSQTGKWSRSVLSSSLQCLEAEQEATALSVWTVLLVIGFSFRWETGSWSWWSLLVPSNWRHSVILDLSRSVLQVLQTFCNTGNWFGKNNTMMPLNLCLIFIKLTNGISGCNEWHSLSSLLVFNELHTSSY